ALQQRLPDRGGAVKMNSTAGRVRPAPMEAVTLVVGLKDSFARAAVGVTSDAVLYAPRRFAAQGKISPIGMRVRGRCTIRAQCSCGAKRHKFFLAPRRASLRDV